MCEPITSLYSSASPTARPVATERADGDAGRRRVRLEGEHQRQPDDRAVHDLRHLARPQVGQHAALPATDRGRRCLTRHGPNVPRLGRHGSREWGEARATSGPGWVTGHNGPSDRAPPQGSRADGAARGAAPRLRRPQRHRARQATRGQAGRGRDGRDPAAHRRAAVPHPRGAQGRRDEVRPGAVGAGVGAAGGGGRRRTASTSPGSRTPHRRCRPRPCARSSSATSARTGRTGSSGSTAARPRPRPSARSTRAAGTTGATSRSRCSTPGAGEALMSDLSSSPGSPARSARSCRASTSSR